MIKASGYVVYNETAIWSAGVTEHDAWANFIKFMNGPTNSIQNFLENGFSVGESTQELIDMVNEQGGAIGWNEVNRVQCTESQYNESQYS